MTSSRWTRVGLGAIGVVYLVAAICLMPLNADDIALAGAYSSDEANSANQILNLYAVGLGTAPSFFYGGGFFYPPAVFLHVIGFFTHVDQHTVILTLRAFCTAAGLGCICLTYLLGLMAVGPLVGLLGALFLASTPGMLRWAVEGHPDLPQLFWTLVALVCCIRMLSDSRRRWPLLVGGAAGLAFGTKYGGLFLMPMLALALLAGPGDVIGLDGLRRLLRPIAEAPFWLRLAGAAVAFGLAFALTNPFAILNPGDLYAELNEHKAILEFGHMLKVTEPGIAWIGLLSGGLGWIHLIAGAAGGVLFTVRLARGEPVFKALLLLMAWTVVYLAYLWINVYVRRERHLLPVLPAVTLVAAWAYVEGMAFLRRRTGMANGAVGLLIAGLAVASVQPALAMAEVFGSKWEAAHTPTPELEAGRWLAETYRPETTILYDAYAYVPSRFANSYRVFGLSYPLVQHFEPDLVVARDAIARDFSDTTRRQNTAAGARLSWIITTSMPTWQGA